MAKIDKTHRDSVLRGRGYSMALGTNNVLGAGNRPSAIEEESMSPSGLLLDGDDDEDDDLLLDGADEDMLLEDFDKDISNKILSFDRAIEKDKEQAHLQIISETSEMQGSLHSHKKQDSAEVLSEDISELTETPKSRLKKPTRASNIGQGVSS